MSIKHAEFEPNGNVKKVDLVVAGLIAHEDKVLLIHHKKLNKWLPPGGHINENETPDDALEREIKEELNLDIEIMNEKGTIITGSIIKHLASPFYVNVHNVGDHNHCCFFYVCKPKNLNKLSINKSELKKYRWFSHGDLNKGDVPEDVRNISSKAFSLLDSI